MNLRPQREAAKDDDDPRDQDTCCERVARSWRLLVLERAARGYVDRDRVRTDLFAGAGRLRERCAFATYVRRSGGFVGADLDRGRRGATFNGSDE